MMDAFVLKLAFDLILEKRKIHPPFPSKQISKMEEGLLKLQLQKVT
jgi:hypothetical protein